MFQIIFRIGVIQLVAIAVNLVRSKVTAVLLGPEGIGVVSVIDQVIQLAAHICALSLPLAAIKVLSLAHSRSEAEFRSSYASMLRILIILSLLGAGAVVLMAWGRASWLNPDIVNFRFYVMIAAFNVPTMVLGNFFTNVFAAAGKVTESAFVAVAANTVMTIASYVGISLGRVAGMYIATAIGGAILTVSILLVLRWRLRLPIIVKGANILEDLRGNRPTLVYSVMLYITSISYTGSLLAVRYSVLRSWGESEAGLLQSAVAVGLALGLVLGPMSGLFLMPLVNREMPRLEKMKAVVDFQKRLMVIMSLAAMGLCLFPELLVRILFSPLFAGAAEWVPFFVLSQCFLQIAGTYQILLIGFDDFVMNGSLTAAGHVVLTFLSVVWGRKFGIGGAAAAVMISSLLILLLAYWRLRVRFEFRMRPAAAAFLLYPMGAILAAAFLFRGSGHLSISVLSLKIATLGALTGSFFLLLSREERQSVYELLRRSKSAAR